MAVRPVAGLATVVAVVGIVAVAATMFTGGFNGGVPVTVLSPRAGLVMYADAKVTLQGAQVGRVTSIEERPNGQAAIHLAMDPSWLHLIPANVSVDVAPTTVFGAKYVQLVAPSDPSPTTMYAGQVLDAQHVTVEINTVFGQLTALLNKMQPEKLNATLGTLAKALNGRGPQMGTALTDLDAFLAHIEPNIPAIEQDLSLAPQVLKAYADAAPDLMEIAKNTTEFSRTLVDQQTNLDALLISVVGLADVGTEVLSQNHQPLANVLHLLVPTTNLLNEYNPVLNCSFAGMLPMLKMAPPPEPGAVVNASFGLGVERYRYPDDLPKVAATGGPQCNGLPLVPPGTRPKFVVADVGANPWKYGNQGIVLNADGLKQLLFGEISGPPRNSGQIGQPG